ncbi:MAG: hypothetical protein Q9226_004388 [Calogaya cf. arnoldii]
MGENHFDHHPATTKHEHDIDVDENLLAKLPQGSKLKSAKGAGESNWNLTGHVIFETREDKEEEYFIKIATGALGKAMFAGEFASMTALHSSIPKHVPRPLSWGVFATGDRYFQLYTFHHFVNGRRPSISSLVSVTASLHSAPSSLSPTGKFGFEMTTYNGNLPQDNTWTEKWEEFYKNGMTRMMDLDAKARGESKELKRLEGDFFDKVVPRLLRPLEDTKKGRSVKAVLLHGDLWVGNASVEEKEGANEEGNCMLFDSSAFYGHNECKSLPAPSSKGLCGSGGLHRAGGAGGGSETKQKQMI